jgi:Tfp pilus assembly protein PilX
MKNIKLRSLNSATSQQGFMMATLISIITVMSVLGAVVLQVIMTNFTTVQNNVRSQKALNIAEAGLNYYLWHLSHNGADFKDGKSTPTTPDANLGYGPYTHNYVDDNGVTSGTYTLWIKPQGNGSTIATVRSIGQVTGTNIIRTVEAQLGAASFANYAVASDSALWFGNTETASGPIHSNIGVRMDGPSNADVTSANLQYTPSQAWGGNGSTPHPGVWCDGSTTTPVDCNTRSKVDWRYPVPLLDYNQVTGTLCTIKKAAFAANAATANLATQANACTQVPTTRTTSYLPRRASAFSETSGYLIELNTNGTYNLYNVNAENDQLTPYTAALTRVLVQAGVVIPSSGVIFAEDNVWVRTSPTYHGRVTVAAGRLASASEAANVVVADNIVYSTKNGSDAIGLIAEDSVIIAPYAPPATGPFNFEVNAAMIAQSGSVLYPGTYRTNDNKCTRGWIAPNQTFSFYGSVATRQGWTWTWLQGPPGGAACGDAVKETSINRYISGIYHNTTQYDYNLQYGPPPSYPLAGGYNILSWREVLTRP